MASHEDLNTAAAGGGTFADRVKGAMLVCAQAIITEADAATNHANRLKWARRFTPTSRETQTTFSRRWCRGRMPSTRPSHRQGSTR